MKTMFIIPFLLFISLSEPTFNVSERVTDVTPGSAFYLVTFETILRGPGPSYDFLASRDTVGTWTVLCPELALETMFQANRRQGELRYATIEQQREEIRELQLQVLELLSHQLHVTTNQTKQRKPYQLVNIFP